MQVKKGSYVLEVVGGDEHGARLEIGDRVLTIGRARDADLVLRDLGVSRRHVQVAASEHGVQFDVCGGASPFMMGGRPLRSAEAKEGDRILVGNTILVVVEGKPDSSQQLRATRGNADVRTVLTGVGADARAMAALHGLIELLDAAGSPEGIESALHAWGGEQTPSCMVDIRRSPDDHLSSTVVEREGPGHSTIVSVPAPCDEPTALAFTITASSDRLTDSFRRMLVVAGRLVGSSLARVHRLAIADGEVESLRALSFGSARAFLGTSPGALQLASVVPRLAASDVSVLIEGETGVGKTFVARLIHEASPRAREPLRVINCAAIPENLAESELFGHERGAFTGANVSRIGALEAAERGTLFLDEIGELSPAIQAKLLHVLEERTFERIGSNRPIDLRARVICATNRNLEEMVEEGTFRRDLLFRIAVVRVRVPPLRDRGEDLVMLARQLLADATQSAGRRVTGFSQGAMKLIEQYPWPGNVRELRNAIDHAIALGEGSVIQVGDLPPGMSLAADQPDDPNLVRLPLDMATLQKRAIEAALAATDGNRIKAAALLGVDRATLYRRRK